MIHADGGKLDKALADMDQQYAIAQKGSDPAGMTGDLLAKGNILIEQGKFDQAKAVYDQSLKTIQESNLSDEVKGNQARFHHFNMTRVALGKKDLATAKSEAAEFQKLAETSRNPFQTKLAHTLDGMLALAEKDWDKAIAELQQGNLHDPYNLYRLSLAYQGKGDKEKAAELAKQAADFNALPALNAAFVRTGRRPRRRRRESFAVSVLDERGGRLGSRAFVWWAVWDSNPDYRLKSRCSNQLS